MTVQFRSASAFRSGPQAGSGRGRSVTAALLLSAIAAAFAPAADAAAPPIAGEGASIAAAPAESVAGAVSAGGVHTCAIGTAGTLACWGHNDFGQSNPPSGTFSGLSAGDITTARSAPPAHSPAGADNDFGQLNNIPSGTFTAISSGLDHTCAIRTAGTLACWGDNDKGQLDNIPTGTFSSVSAGVEHTCAIRTDGTLACWGTTTRASSTTSRQARSPRSAPATTTPARSAAAGTLACWGNNDYGQLDNIPTGTFSAVAAGLDHTCAIRTAGTPRLLGPEQRRPARQHPDRDVHRGQCRQRHSCAVRSAGTLACWGDNTDDQTGIPTGTFTGPAVSAGSVPQLRDQDRPARSACWGANGSGQAHPPSGTARAVSAADIHSCALKTSRGSSAGARTRAGKIANPFPNGLYTAVSAGAASHLRAEPRRYIFCWGDESQRTARFPRRLLHRDQLGPVPRLRDPRGRRARLLG